MNITEIRKDFPILNREFKGKPIIYLDNTATSQKPRQVIDALVNFYSEHNSNVHRGMHRLSREASLMYEGAHDKVAKFVNAKGREEIVFTKNTTESINLVSHSLDWNDGDEVVVTEMEHHSNIIPWFMLKSKGVKVKFVKVKDDGTVDMDHLAEIINNKTKLVSFVHISNFLGTINPAEEITKIAHDSGAKVLLDAAQSAPHMELDFNKIGCDFAAFSAHKMCGPTGIGVLYGRQDLLEKMNPFLGGGDMIKTVDYDKFESHVLPWKFEAGTSNIAGGYAFGVTIDYLKKIGMKNIHNHEQELTKYALDQMKDLNKIKIYGPLDFEKRGGLISFNVEGIPHHDVATLLDERENIAVRSGYHCVEPLHKKLGAAGSVRASFYLYNTKEEIDKFISTLKQIIDVLG